MSQGKYSPRRPHADEQFTYDYRFNCYGKEVEPYDHLTVTFDEKIHLAHYDEEGFDRYGYSGFGIFGHYVGIGQGVDRLGYTEDEYGTMSYDEWEQLKTAAIETRLEQQS